MILFYAYVITENVSWKLDDIYIYIIYFENTANVAIFVAIPIAKTALKYNNYLGRGGVVTGLLLTLWRNGPTCL